MHTQPGVKEKFVRDLEEAIKLIMKQDDRQSGKKVKQKKKLKRKDFSKWNFFLKFYCFLLIKRLKFIVACKRCPIQLLPT